MGSYSDKFGADYRRDAMTFNVPPSPGQSRPVAAAAEPAEHTTKQTSPGRFETRDRVERIGAISLLDSSNRVSAKKGIEALGWTAATVLVVEFEDGAAVVRPRTEEGLDGLLPVTHVDDVGRLRLPPDTRRALNVDVGDQVIATAVPQCDELHLGAAADLLQFQTGSRTPLAPVVPLDAPTSAAEEPKRSRVKRARYSA